MFVHATLFINATPGPRFRSVHGVLQQMNNSTIHIAFLAVVKSYCYYYYLLRYTCKKMIEWDTRSSCREKSIRKHFDTHSCHIIY